MAFHGHAPLHGNQGDREPGTPKAFQPGFIISISREAGASGTSIAQRVRKRLGCQMYTREVLEYLCNQESERNQMIAQTSKEALEWVDAQILRIRKEKRISPDLLKTHLPRLILILATSGNAIFVGAGAGYLLPMETSLHVRLYGREEDRLKHLSEWLRLPPHEAKIQLERREERRIDFLMTYFRDMFDDETVYDLSINSTNLGEEASAEVITLAAKSKSQGGIQG
jgi:cytidylate kinase